MYTYYRKEEKEEHYLLANEIAKMYNVVTSSGKEATNFVSALLQHDVVSHEEEYYYQTRFGMTRVYPYKIYDITMRTFVMGVSLAGQMNEFNTYNMNGKNYTVKVLQQEPQ